jgi:hypothetical protein
MGVGVGSSGVGVTVPTGGVAHGGRMVGVDVGVRVAPGVSVGVGVSPGVGDRVGVDVSPGVGVTVPVGGCALGVSVTVGGGVNVAVGRGGGRNGSQSGCPT